MKQETKHSPAPWYPINYGGYIHLQSEDYYSNSNLLDEDKCDRAIANGQLASCAPDLLEALQELTELFKKTSEVFPVLHNEKAYSKAKEVIKKATEI